MYLSRWLVMLSAVMLGQGMVSLESATAATKTSTSKTKQAVSRVKAPAKLPKVSSESLRRKISPPQLSNKARLAKTVDLTKKAGKRKTGSVKPPLKTAPASKAELLRRTKIEPAKVRSKIDATRLKEAVGLKEQVARERISTGTKGNLTGGQKPGQVGGNNSFAGIATRAGAIRGKTADQAKGANSSTLRGLESVMPGFRDRARGGSSLRDLAGGASNHRNPITTGSSLGNFAGGGSGQFSDGGVISAHKNKQGDIVIVKENGDIVTRYKNGDRGVNKANGDTEYTFAERKVAGTPQPPIEPIDYGSGSKGSGGKHSGGKQGSQKEPTPDDTTDTSGSVPRYVSGAQLRGLAAKLGSRGEPTGDEASSGGPVDKSKTREGRNSQVGEPINDVQAVTAFMPDKVQVKQALQLRLRNVTPMPR